MKNETAYQWQCFPLIYEQKGSLEKHVAKNHSNNAQWQIQTSIKEQGNFYEIYISDYSKQLISNCEIVLELPHKNVQTN